MRYRPIAELRAWEHNMFIATEEGAARVSDNIELLGNKLDPLVAMPDGTILSGSRRINIYREKGLADAPCIEVDVVEDGNGMWKVIVEGEEQKGRWSTKDSAMQYISMSRNNQTGHLDTEKLANEGSEFDIDWNQFSANFEAMPTVADFIESVAPGSTSNPGELKYRHRLIIEASSAEEQNQLYFKLAQDGFNVKAETKVSKVKPKVNA